MDVNEIDFAERTGPRFTCPRCSSHFFSTYDKGAVAVLQKINDGMSAGAVRSDLVGLCHGHSDGVPCRFEWKRTPSEDRKYFTEVPCENYPEATKKEATMSDRHSGYIVVLDTDMRDDDAQPTLDAIRQIRGVIDVRPVVADPQGAIAAVRARNELRGKLLDVLLPGDKKP